MESRGQKVVEVIIPGEFTFLVEAVGEMGLCIDTNALFENFIAMNWGNRFPIFYCHTWSVLESQAQCDATRS